MFLDFEVSMAFGRVYWPKHAIFRKVVVHITFPPARPIAILSCRAQVSQSLPSCGTVWLTMAQRRVAVVTGASKGIGRRVPGNSPPTVRVWLSIMRLDYRSPI